MVDDLLRMERRLAERVHEFELGALLEQIRRLGYQFSDIRYRSHHSTVSQRGLIQRIQFRRLPRRRVTIFMNLGLLGAQSPLPSYFFKVMDEGKLDNSRFRDFIAFFDHRVIENHLLNLYPELNQAYFPDWSRTTAHYLSLMDMEAPSSLCWLLRLVFPELVVQVDKGRLARGLRNAPIVLGRTSLGSDAILGSSTSVPVNGVVVTLHGNEELCQPDRPWPDEIRQRLTERVFPVIADSGVDLQVSFVIRGRPEHLRLGGSGHLGYDVIHGGSADERTISIFSGRVQSRNDLHEGKRGAP